MKKGRFSGLFVILYAFAFPSESYAQSLQGMVQPGAQVFALKNAQYDSFNEVPDLLREDWQTHSSIRWDITKPLAAISYQVYEEEPIITRYFLSSMGFELVAEIPYQTMYGYIAVVDDVMVIAFRGTNITSMSDWHVNWQYRQQYFLGHLFHEGFVDHYLAMEPKIRAAINNRRPKHIWITGHSLGGALAVVAAAHLHVTLGVEPRLCTFGQPRVTDSEGATWLDSLFNNRYARFVNGSDIVPSLPPTYPLIRIYGHAGDLYAFGLNDLTISQSTLTIPPNSTIYCGHCGRSTIVDQREPTYQSSQEKGPLTKDEYDQILAHEDRHRHQFRSGANSLDTTLSIFNYFSDHKMGKYVQAAHSFGSTERTMSIPGR